MSLPRGGCTKARPAPFITSSMLMFDVVRACDLGSWEVAGRASTSAIGSVNVRCNGDVAGASESRGPDRLDQVLKCAGGGRDPVGRAGRLVRRSCR
jgi:hypothetical protein